MDIVKFKDNYNKNRKPKCFNCNVYRHIAKDCQKPKEEKETRKWYRYNKIGYLVKDCRLEKRMKNWSIQKDSDDKDKENNNKEGGFVKGLE